MTHIYVENEVYEMKTTIKLADACDAIMNRVQRGRRWPLAQRLVAERVIRRTIRQMMDELRKA